MQNYNELVKHIDEAMMYGTSMCRISFLDIIKKTNTYTFRGQINVSHLINDCVKDGKYAFIAIGEKDSVVGISGLLTGDIQLGGTPIVLENISTFRVATISKEYTGKAIKFLETVPGLIKKQMAKEARKIRKGKKAGKFANQPATKVMVW